MNEPILSNFPKRRKKKKSFKQMIIDKSFDILFGVAAITCIGFTLFFCFSVKNVEALPDLQPKPIITEIKPVEPTLIGNPIPEKVIEEAIDIPLTDDYLIASIVMAEAEGEEMVGKVAVASAIINRCEAWGKTVSEVINQPDQFAKGEEPNEDCLRAVEIARETRDLFPSDMLYFRNAHYHDFGCPFLVIGGHYFSTETTEKGINE